MFIFESADGLNWHLAKNVLVHYFHIDFSDGASMDFSRLEMPKVYMENGEVKVIFLAAKPVNSEKSFSIVLPVVEQ